jgi:phage FluMu protein Com
MRISRTLRETSPVAVSACEDVRCGCGSLLARVIDGTIELKCRRCKQVWRLPIDGSPGSFTRPVRVDGR